MIVARSMSAEWLSNTWLVADRPGGAAIVIDTGGPAAPILRQIEELGVRVSHVLCTHHHHDHVANNGVFRAQFGCPVCAHSAEAELFDEPVRTLEDGEEIGSGALTVRTLHIPGHTRGQAAFEVREKGEPARIFTGDTLFKGSVGGTRAPGHTDFADLRRSILDVLMALPHETPVHPGHMHESTIGREWEENPFIRAWRGVDPVEPVPCTVRGAPATLLLRARDYDEGTKCWIRHEDGTEDVVPGSIVRDGDAP